MAKNVCELCQQNLSADTRFGVSLCKDCIVRYEKAFSGDAAAISCFSDPQSFPYATDTARRYIIGTVSVSESRNLDEQSQNTSSAVNNFVKPIDKKPVFTAYEQPNDTDGLLDRLYENIGKKIKNWAKWIFVLEAIVAVISGFVLLLADEELLLIGLLLIFLGPIVSLVSTWLLYGFGELIEKTSSNEKYTHDILKLMNKNSGNG